MSIPQVEQCPPIQALALTRRCKIWQMPKVMAAGFAQLCAAAEAQGIALTGLPFVHYLGLDWNALTRGGLLQGIWGFFTQVWHFEMAVPLARKPQGQGALKAITYPACQAVTALHHGPYHRMSHSYRALHRWMLGQGFKPAADCYEFYRNDPHDTPAEELETLLVVPVSK